ncbi:MAG: hypothetical protein HY703_11425 [Gemmatimonadetes bacterium]|nr:hypothetical protein [Gemmatimonadota bacterium]
MARYDRIAPLEPPSRERAFPGWPVLRDLETQERDADLARRARLRFLALRPVRRLLERGLGNVAAESYERQIEGVREELGQLSARDPERARLAHFLHHIRDREPALLARATLEAGGFAETAGYRQGAEEFYRTALELAEVQHLRLEKLEALRRLGTLSRPISAATAEAYFRRAIELALPVGEHEEWALAMEGLGSLQQERGQADDAASTFREILERGRAWGDERIIAGASASLCTHELRGGRLERALEHGWTALGLLQDEPRRCLVLADLATAFARLGIFPAAERCYQIVALRSPEPGPRAQARARHAALAAEAGDAASFRSRRQQLLKEAGEFKAHPAAYAALHLELGRGCLLAGDADFARDHLRQALATARKHHFPDVLRRAEEMLPILEHAAAGIEPARPTTTPPGTLARRIAAQVESFGQALVPASS